MTCIIVSGSEKHLGQTVTIPRVTLNEDIYDSTTHFSRYQFPVKCAFGMTINKAQGQTIAEAGVLLSSSVFSHSQLYVVYVACSRVPKRENLKIFIRPSDLKDRNGISIADTSRLTRNIVQGELLN